MKHKTSVCPNCHSKLDKSSPLTARATPRPNDCSVCLYCGCWLIFDEELALRRLTGAEIDGLSYSDRMQMIKAEAVARAVLQAMGREPVKPPRYQ